MDQTGCSSVRSVPVKAFSHGFLNPRSAADSLLARRKNALLLLRFSLILCVSRASSHLLTGSWNLSVNSPLMWELKKKVIIKIISCFFRAFRKYRKEPRRKTNHPQYQHAEATGNILGMTFPFGLAFFSSHPFKTFVLLTLGIIVPWFDHEKAFLKYGEKHPTPCLHSQPPALPRSLSTYFLYLLPALCIYSLVQIRVYISLSPAGSTLSSYLGSTWGVSLVLCYSGEVFLCTDRDGWAFIPGSAVLMHDRPRPGFGPPHRAAVNNSSTCHFPHVQAYLSGHFLEACLPVQSTGALRICTAAAELHSSEAVANGASVDPQRQCTSVFMRHTAYS